MVAMYTCACLRPCLGKLGAHALCQRACGSASAHPPPDVHNAGLLTIDEGPGGKTGTKQSFVYGVCECDGSEMWCGLPLALLDARPVDN